MCCFDMIGLGYVLVWALCAFVNVPLHVYELDHLIVSLHTPGVLAAALRCLSQCLGGLRRGFGFAMDPCRILRH